MKRRHQTPAANGSAGRSAEATDLLGELPLEAIEGIGFWVWEVASGRIAWTRELEHVFGFAPGTSAGHYAEFRDRVHPDDIDRLERTRDEAVAARRNYLVQYRVILPDGGMRWVASRGRADYDADGTPLHVFGCDSDITAEKLAQTERDLSERSLRLSLSAVPLTVFRQNHELRYVSVSNSVIGIPDELVVGRGDEDLFTPPDAAVLSAIKRRVLESGRGERHEIPVDLAGKRRWFDTIVEPERDESGAIIGLICASHEVSERREREERYRTVLEDQTEVICRFSPDGTFLYVNETYCRFFGKRADDLVGKSWHPRAHLDDLAMIEARLATLAPDNPVVTIENRVWSAAGEMRWMQFVNRAFFDADGSIRELQAVGRDITERKAAEAELDTYRAGLLRLLQENDRLREQQRKEIARDIHDQIGAHLTTLRWKIESLTKSPAVDPGVRAQLDETLELLVRTAQTTRQICTELRPPALDDLGLVDTCRWYLREWGEQTGIRTRMRVSGSLQSLPETVCVDLFRIVQELLTNVARHASATRVSLGLTLDACELRLKLSDDGRGFDPASATRGLGLIGCRERLARHGGKLAIASTGRGCALTCSVPVASRA